MAEANGNFKRLSDSLYFFVKIATWNINGIASRIDQVIRWSAGSGIDILCLQETKTVDSRFPILKLRRAGFEHTEFAGEKAYNGVAIVSRLPLKDVAKELPFNKDDIQKRFLAATAGGVRVVNVYVPHGTKLGSERFRYKLDWLARLRKYFDKNFKPGDPVILCGDLNVAAHEMDVWKASLWKDKLHFSKPEREALLDLKKWGFVDLYRSFNEDEREFSWWSNFHNDFEKDRGLRIDQLWSSPALAERCLDCWIDKEPRAWEHPSDHAPVIAELAV